MTPLNIAVVSLVVIGVVLLFNMCSRKEGMSIRLPTNRVILDNAYSYKQFPDYTVNHKFNLDSRENYSPDFKCRTKCQNVQGNSPKENCYFTCMNNLITGPLSGGVSCSHNNECGPEELCIKPGAYNTGEGYCVNTNEPGVIPTRSSKSVEKFAHIKTCGPSKFYNEVTNRCESRFQGASSTYAVHHMKPIPDPFISIPGGALSGYGVGISDPVDLVTNYKLELDQ